jgi:RimJ/RimL family protein N-acetyltransferase
VILETERLLLREFVPEDVDALMAVVGDPVTMQFYPAPFTREEVNNWILRNRARYASDGFGLWAMLLKSTGELIGDCGFFVRDVQESFDFELAWHVHRDHWGQGYATEAAQGCIEHAFARLAADRIIALVRPENLSSCLVAEKSGMTRERAILWYGYDHCVYAKHRNLNNGC